jgi:hypothetical protein
MIVQSGNTDRTGKIEMPDLANVLDLSADVGADSWMAEGGTDLLSGQRWRSLRNLILMLVVLGGVGVGIFMLITMKSGDDNQTVNAPVPIDAAVRRQIDEPKPDAADLSRDDIRALSKFGFFSIDSPTKATIYVDNVRLGDTPIERAPVQPGPHKVKAVTKGKKPKEWTITIVGGRDTDEGMITW